MKTHSHRVGIRTCSDYSPFGVELDGRTVSGGYRYGFQNQEKDDEVNGMGKIVSYEFRMQEPLLGRFISKDPLSKRFPKNSPYAFSENKVIGIEPCSNVEKITKKDKNNWTKNLKAEPKEILEQELILKVE